MVRNLGFEAQIAAAPDDDAPRRVYADWLLERDSPRGELVAVQCELAALAAGDPRCPALMQREYALLESFGPQWLAELGLGAEAKVKAGETSCSERHTRGSVVVFRRGFPDEAKLGLPQFLGAAEPLAGTPLRRLVLTGISGASPDQLRAFAAARPLPALDVLCFRRLRLGADPWAGLAGAPLLGTVTGLELHDAHLDVNPGGPRLPGLRRLDLASGSIRGLQALIEACPQLEALEIDGTWVDGLWELFRSDDLRHLRVLRLDSSRVDDAVVSALASARTALTHLDLRGNELGDEGVQSLVRTRRLSRLEVLRVSERRLAPEHAVALRRRFGDRLVLDRW